MSLEPPLNPPSTVEIIDVESFRFTRNRDTHVIDVDHYHSHVINLSDAEDDDDDVRVLNFIPLNTTFGNRRRRRSINDTNDHCVEKGESSNSTPFFCEICADTKTAKDAFSISGCSHAYCSECVAMYVGSKLQENVINIRCPVSGCSGLLEAEYCRAILPPEVFDRWGKASCEAVISASEKFYCPFADCSALLIDDGTETVRESECPNCGRLFCAQCKVPWHMGIECDEFQKLNEDERGKEDVMLMHLAKEMKWMRCPNCRFYVAKSEGCMYMKCRCGYAFCYNCGTANSSNSHYCRKCRR